MTASTTCRAIESAMAALFQRMYLALALAACTSAFAPPQRSHALLRLRAEVEDAPAAADAPPRSAPPQSSQERMKQKLKNEADYPLFIPLLGASVVVGGKGLTDALLTFAKVSAGMRGASLSETFLGVPVLGIDAVCVVVGVALGAYTWENQRPPSDA